MQLSILPVFTILVLVVFNCRFLRAAGCLDGLKSNLLRDISTVLVEMKAAECSSKVLVVTDGNGNEYKYGNLNGFNSSDRFSHREVKDEDGNKVLELSFKPEMLGVHKVQVFDSEQQVEENGETFVLIPGLTILPSIITVILAIFLKQNILALFVGVFVGETISNRYRPDIGILRVLDTVIVDAVADRDHAQVIYFCFLIGGLIALLGKGGGAMGMAKKIASFAKTRIRGQLTTFVVGIIVFFDDYASCLISGSTMRDLAKPLRISREKLAFIVDTCASTITCVFLVSSWTGVEIDNIKENKSTFGQDSPIYNASPYDLFLSSIPYRFYPLYVLIFTLLIIVMKRDFGPMLKAERRTLRTGKVSSNRAKPMVDVNDETMTPIEGKPQRWINGALPFIILVSLCFTGMLVDGYLVVREKKDAENNFKNYIQHGRVFNALLWSTMASVIVAMVMLISQKILTLSEAMESFMSGAKSMVFAVMILMHAWSLATVCKSIKTSSFLASFIDTESFSAGLLPALIFIIGAVISFSTGSAWGTMAILFPLVLPLLAKWPNNLTLFSSTLASILSGSVWGNHASPISDSCIMTSTSTGCDLSDHIKTQVVYAVTVGIISLLLGYIPVGCEIMPAWASLIVGTCFMVLLLLLIGEDPADESGKGSILVRYTPKAVKEAFARFVSFCSNSMIFVSSKLCFFCCQSRTSADSASNDANEDGESCTELETLKIEKDEKYEKDEKDDDSSILTSQITSPV